MGTFIVNAFLRYIQSHEDVLDQLIDAAVQAFIAHLKNPAPTK